VSGPARGIVSAVVGAVIVQSAIAAVLIVHGNVALPHALPRNGWGLEGVACGVLLHVALPAKAAIALRTPSRAALIQLGLLLACVAIAEEVIWRGFIFASIRGTSGSLVAFITTTVGFAAMHTFAQGWSGVRTHLITGAGIGLVFWMSDSLVSAIAVHVSYNLMFLLGLRPQRRHAS
jgi:membrane protease YdiL (CAAX protease family)